MALAHFSVTIIKEVDNHDELSRNLKAEKLTLQQQRHRIQCAQLTEHGPGGAEYRPSHADLMSRMVIFGISCIRIGVQQTKNV